MYFLDYIIAEGETIKIDGEILFLETSKLILISFFVR